MKKFLPMFSFLFVVFIIVLYTFYNNADTLTAPDRIIVYKDGAQSELSKTDPKFNDVVELTNKRIDRKNLAVCKDGGNIDFTVTESKKTGLSIEFIYENEQTMKVTNQNHFPTLNYNKLFFKLSDDGYSIDVFQYGNKDVYVDSSRGPLFSPEDIVSLLK